MKTEKSNHEGNTIQNYLKISQNFQEIEKLEQSKLKTPKKEIE